MNLGSVGNVSLSLNYEKNVWSSTGITSCMRDLSSDRVQLLGQRKWLTPDRQGGGSTDQYPELAAGDPAEWRGLNRSMWSISRIGTNLEQHPRLAGRTGSVPSWKTANSYAVQKSVNWPLWLTRGESFSRPQNVNFTMVIHCARPLWLLRHTLAEIDGTDRHDRAMTCVSCRCESRYTDKQTRFIR